MNDKNRFVVTNLTIEQERFLTMFLLDEDRNAIEIDVQSLRNQSLIGNVYIAKVINIVTNINAAFLEIKDGQKVFYSLNDSDNIIYTKNQNGRDELCQGDEIVVQVIKDAIKTKDPIVSSNITFETEHVMLTGGKRTIGISKKITGDNRNRLKEIISEITMDDASNSYGFILRTNSADCRKEELLSEMQQLQEEYHKFLQTVIHKTCFTLVREARPDYLNKLRQLDAKTTRIVTDDSNIYDKLQSYCEENMAFSPWLAQIDLYTDVYSLDKLYNLNKKITDALSTNVWLRSGAYLVIEPTEALTVIDVNSGKNIKKSKRQDSFVQINMEAAKMIATQLRLRNISGMILVDFINMDSTEAEEELLMALRKYTRDDPMKVQVIDMTPLGLVEITRQKKRQTLRQQVNSQLYE